MAISILYEVKDADFKKLLFSDEYGLKQNRKGFQLLNPALRMGLIKYL